MKNVIVALAAAGLLVVACNHESYPPSTTTTTGANVVTNDDAVERLTDSYCRRAKDCNYVGNGDDKRYADANECKREYKHDLEARFRPGQCPGGIRGDKLSSCLQEIQNEQCGNVSDHLSRSFTCRTSALCID